MEFRRKRNRIANFDYAADAIYFLTVCAADRAPLFGVVSPGSDFTKARVALSDVGRMVESAVLRLPAVFPGVAMLHYVIMPNHVHLLVQTQGASVSVSSVMNYFKGYVSRRAKRHVWQKSFYDHVVRNETDFQRIWAYIETNPEKWTEDRYFIPE